MKSHPNMGVTALFFSVLFTFSPISALAAETGSTSPASSFVSSVKDTARSTWGWGKSLGNTLTLLGSEPVQNLKVPVFGITVSKIYDSWGDPRSGGRSHEGIDIMAPRGTPVISPTKAVVASIGYGANGGNYVYTTNPGGERFYYAHLDSYADGIVSGKVLEAGDVIGFVGNTGNASGGATHLHFGIYKGGASNPFPRITQDFTVEENISALNRMVANAISKETLASKLAASYRSLLNQAPSKGIALESALNSALGITTVFTAQGSTAKLASAPSSLLRDLTLGSTGEDVRMLQKFLNTHGATVAASGAGSPGNETSYFGPATQAALAQYQKAKGISPSAGYFGPLTRSLVARETATIVAMN